MPRRPPVHAVVERVGHRPSSFTSPPLVFIACVAAPVPRPPQPTRPILIVSLPKAWAPRATCTWLAAIAPPATRSELFRRNVRRDVPEDLPAADLVEDESAAGERSVGRDMRGSSKDRRHAGHPRRNVDGKRWRAKPLAYRAGGRVAIKCSRVPGARKRQRISPLSESASKKAAAEAVPTQGSSRRGKRAASLAGRRGIALKQVKNQGRISTEVNQGNENQAAHLPFFVPFVFYCSFPFCSRPLVQRMQPGIISATLNTAEPPSRPAA